MSAILALLLVATGTVPAPPASAALPAGHRTVYRSSTDERFVGRRRNYGMAILFARCVYRRAPDKVREVVDGEPNTTDTVFTLDWLVRTQPACKPNSVNDVFSDAGYFGHSALVRGAMTEVVLEQLAPTPPKPLWEADGREKLNIAAAERFNAMEGSRNGKRFGEDYAMFQAASCFTAAEPTLSRAVLRSRLGSVRENEALVRLVARASVCVRDGRSVVADRTLMRAYLADAIYRWTLAETGARSLFVDRRGQLAPDVRLLEPVHLASSPAHQPEIMP